MTLVTVGTNYAVFSSVIGPQLSLSLYLESGEVVQFSFRSHTEEI